MLHVVSAHFGMAWCFVVPLSKLLRGTTQHRQPRLTTTTCSIYPKSGQALSMARGLPLSPSPLALPRPYAQKIRRKSLRLCLATCINIIYFLRIILRIAHKVRSSLIYGERVRPNPPAPSRALSLLPRGTARNSSARGHFAGRACFLCSPARASPRKRICPR